MYNPVTDWTAIVEEKTYQNVPQTGAGRIGPPHCKASKALQSFLLGTGQRKEALRVFENS